MSRATLLLIALLVIAAGVDALPVDGEAVVLHAEPPVLSQLARLVPMKARVRVRVGSDGSVAAADVLEPRPPFVALISEKAACLWRFSPAPDGVERSYVLTFDYAATVTSEQPAGWLVTRDEDSLTLRVQYFQSHDTQARSRRVCADAELSPSPHPDENRSRADRVWIASFLSSDTTDRGRC